MLRRRALGKFLFWSKYRGNLMYMIYLTLLWLNFRITGHWNIPQQSTQDCYRGPRSAVQWSEASQCSVHVITVPRSLIHIKRKKHTIHYLNIPRSLIHKSQLSHFKAGDFNSCLNSVNDFETADRGGSTFTHLVNFTFTECEREVFFEGNMFYWYLKVENIKDKFQKGLVLEERVSYMI